MTDGKMFFGIGSRVITGRKYVNDVCVTPNDGTDTHPHVTHSGPNSLYKWNGETFVNCHFTGNMSGFGTHKFINCDFENVEKAESYPVGAGGTKDHWIIENCEFVDSFITGVVFFVDEEKWVQNPTVHRLVEYNGMYGYECKYCKNELEVEEFINDETRKKFWTTVTPEIKRV